MPNRPEFFSFEHMAPKDGNALSVFENKFNTTETISQNEVKAFAKKIAGTIRKLQTYDEQTKVLVDFLSDDKIKNLVENKIELEFDDFANLKDKNGNLLDIDDTGRNIQKMATDTTLAIKKMVIEELKKYLSPKLYFIIKDHKANEMHQSCLKTLKDSLEQLKNPDEEMPYIVHPLLIEEPKKNFFSQKKNLGYTVEKNDFITLQEIFEDEKTRTIFSIRDGLIALVDCIKGTKFLAKNGLTLTDINTIDLAKNLGINKKTKKGLLFDLDGLQAVNQNIILLIGPVGTRNNVKNFFPPEYRPLITEGVVVTALAESMIWEFGETLYTIAQKQKKESEDSLTSSYNANKIKGWNKIIKLAEMMTIERPIERPNFDTCINELTKIIEEYFND